MQLHLRHRTQEFETHVRRQCSHSQSASPITHVRSARESQGSSSVKSVTHWRHEHGIL